MTSLSQATSQVMFQVVKDGGANLLHIATGTRHAVNTAVRSADFVRRSVVGPALSKFSAGERAGKTRFVSGGHTSFIEKRSGRTPAATASTTQRLVTAPAMFTVADLSSSRQAREEEVNHWQLELGLQTSML